MLRKLAIAVAAAIAAGSLGPWPVYGQSSAPQTFEVASVKPNKSGENNVRINVQPGGRFIATNVALRALIRFAYQLQDFQMVGGPDWQTTDRFDILAKSENELVPTAPGTVGPIQLMVRALLADCFKLAVHQEKREMPMYALVVARSDGRLGPQLQPSTVDCQAMVTASLGRGGVPTPPPPTTSGRPVCGMRTMNGQMMAGGFPLSQLAASLSQAVQRTVVDRTGLTGNFDLELKFTPDQMPQGTPPPGAPPSSQIDPNGPSIFTALQEQLGLKLDSQRGMVDVLVVDHAERPTEN